DVVRVNTVDVLARIDGVDDGPRIDVVRQRQLHQDAVDLRIAVQLLDEPEQLRLGDARRQVPGKGAHAHLGAGTSLVAYVGVRGGIVAHEQHREPGRAAAPGVALLDALPQLLLQLPGDGFAVDQARGHGRNGCLQEVR